MDPILNPFVGDGYSLATLTDAINVFPNQYGRIGEIGLFGGDGDGVPDRTIIVENVNGVLNLLPTKPVGAPGTTGTSGKSNIRSFKIPHIPHDDALMPGDIASRRAPGSANQLMPQDVALAQKLQTMRNKHAITLEHLRMGAVKGVILDADGSTLYDLYDEFDIVAKTVDFVLGTAGTEVSNKCREVVRHVEDHLFGETMTSIRVLVSQEFFDKLITHATVKDAYKYFSTSGAQPLREDTRRFFPFNGLVFEEYRGQATQQNQDGTTTARRFIAANDGHAFPIGTLSTFKQYNAPADFNETVNTPGLPMYAKMAPRKFERGWDIHTQSNPLPLCRRPEVLVRVYSSN